MNKKVVNIFISAMISALLVTACAGGDTEVQTGDLQVSYQVGSGAKSCEEAGISFVRLYVSVSDTSEVVDEVYACNAGDQTILLQDIEVGSYSVHAEGLDGDNNAIYLGQASGNVAVEADRTNGPVLISLDQVRPSIEIIFDFEGAGGCDRFGVIDIAVVVYQDGVSKIHEKSYVCGNQLNDSLLIGDLSASSTYDIRVRGTNENGEYIYEFNQDDIEVAPGLPTEVAAVMEACSGLCSNP